MVCRTAHSAGEALLPHAQRLLHEEQMVKHMFSDIANQEQGSLRIAVTIPRCRCLLPKIVHDFKQRYPNVGLDILTPSTTSALNMVVSGDCNVAIGMLRLKHSDLEMIQLTKDPWYVLIPNSLLREYCSEEQIAEILNSEQITYSMISKIPIIAGNNLSDPEGESKRKALDPEYSLNILFTSSSPQSFPEFAIQGYAALIVSQMSLMAFRDLLPDHVHILPLKTSESSTIISLAYNKEQYMPSHCKYFIQLVTEYFKE